MWLRANIVLAIAVVFAVVQMFASATGGPRFGDMSALANSPSSGLTRTVAAQDDNDEDDEDNDDDDDDDDDNDEDDSDNDDDDSDNDDDNDDDADNDDDDSDNDDDADNDDDSDNDDDDSDNDDSDDSDNDDTADADPSDIGDAVLDNIDPTTSTAAAPSATPATTTSGASTSAAPSTTTGTPSPSLSAVTSPAASPQPTTEAQLVTAGMDATLALQGDRVAVQVFPTMPAGITLKLRMVDPLMYPATPGIRAGDLIFQLDATDVSGMPLATLPSEVNISVHYMDSDVTGLDDTAITLSRLDTLDSTWKTAPKLLTDPTTNYLAASVMDTGVYAVYVP